MIKNILSLFLCSLIAIPAFADIEDEATPDIVLRGPASVTEQLPPRDQLLEMTARVERFTDSKTIVAGSNFKNWSIGEVVAVESQNAAVGIVAFVEVSSVESNPRTGNYTVRFQLLRHSRTNMIQVGDTIYRLDLSTENPRYKGTTDLIIKRRSDKVSARYKPLFTQGLNIGATAQSLWNNELLITYYGLLYYGVTEKLTIGSVLPAAIAGAPNGNFKYKVFETDSNVVSAGLSYAKIQGGTQNALNFDFYWDGISSDSQITHVFATIAIYTFNNAEDSTAVKSLGTTSFQSGYEFILNNWDRFLIGPSYNVENKSIGGYSSYVMIWDKFHFALSANTTNIQSTKVSVKDGYYFFADAYWRF